jgi:feruloyl esterase
MALRPIVVNAADGRCRALFLASVIVLLLVPGEAMAAACADLVHLTLPTTTITSAALVAPGTLKVPGASAGAQATFARLGEFCRVAATLRPSADSDIKIEVWLPSQWNGKFQAVGNGLWAGVIPYAPMAGALAEGYATAGTDTGHVGNTAAFALGHPEKVIDIGYRAVHEMTAQAKSLINSFYGRTPQFSIWNGCSLGGRQGIAEAVRYPEDFDGVIAGAPAVNWMNLHAGRMAANRAANRTDAATIPQDKYALIHNAVLAACDANDGVKDGLIENPMSCRFDPKVLQCSSSALVAGDTASCLTPPQVNSARALYAPVRDPKTGQEVMPGLAPGSELTWAIAAARRPVATALEAFKYIVFENPNWDPATFNAATDIERALRIDRNDTLNASSTDLKAFFERGGKLLMYHGWADTQVTPLNSINYFEKVVSRFGPQSVGTSIQLYMAPGMNHCNGGAGPDVFNKVAALEQWMSTGMSPEKIVAARFTSSTIDRTRPLCTYGRVAKWTGSGSPDDAWNFSCVVPDK